MSHTQKTGLCAQVWALYDPIDEMPRTWVRVKKVHALGSPFEVKATWLEPDGPCEQALERQKVWLFSSLLCKMKFLCKNSLYSQF